MPNIEELSVRFTSDTSGFTRGATTVETKLTAIESLANSCAAAMVTLGAALDTAAVNFGTASVGAGALRAEIAAMNKALASQALAGYTSRIQTAGGSSNAMAQQVAILTERVALLNAELTKTKALAPPRPSAASGGSQMPRGVIPIPAGNANNWAAFDKFGGQAVRSGRMMTQYLTVPIVAAEIAAVHFAAQFEASMAKIEGLAGVPHNMVAGWSTEIRQLAVETGRMPNELAKAMFFIASEGNRGKAAMDILRMSAKMAAIGMGDAAFMAQKVSIAIHDFQWQSLSAGHAADVLTAAVKEGNVAAESLVPALSRVSPLASQMRIPFEQLMGTFAALTREGLSAAEAGTGIRQMLATLEHPSKQTQKALASVHLTAKVLREQMQTDLLGTLQRIQTAFGKNQEGLAHTFPNIRAFIAFLGIMNGKGIEASGIIDRVTHSAGYLDHAMGVASETMQQKLNVALAKIENAFIGLGGSSAKGIEILATDVGKLADSFGRLDPRTQAIIAEVALFAAALGPVTTGIGGAIHLVSMMRSGIAILTGTTTAATRAQQIAAGSAVRLGQAEGDAALAIARLVLALEAKTKAANDAAIAQGRAAGSADLLAGAEANVGRAAIAAAGGLDTAAGAEALVGNNAVVAAAKVGGLNGMLVRLAGLLGNGSVASMLGVSGLLLGGMYLGGMKVANDLSAEGERRKKWMSSDEGQAQMKATELQRAADMFKHGGAKELIAAVKGHYLDQEAFSQFMRQNLAHFQDAKATRGLKFSFDQAQALSSTYKSGFGGDALRKQAFAHFDEIRRQHGLDAVTGSEFGDPNSPYSQGYVNAFRALMMKNAHVLKNTKDGSAGGSDTSGGGGGGRGRKPKESEAEKEHDSMLESINQKLHEYAKAQKQAGDESEYAALKAEILTGEYNRLVPRAFLLAKAAGKSDEAVLKLAGSTLQGALAAAKIHDQWKQTQELQKAVTDSSLEMMKAMHPDPKDQAALEQFKKLYSDISDKAHKAAVDAILANNQMAEFARAGQAAFDRDHERLDIRGSYDHWKKMVDERDQPAQDLLKDLAELRSQAATTAMEVDRAWGMMEQHRKRLSGTQAGQSYKPQDDFKKFMETFPGAQEFLGAAQGVYGWLAAFQKLVQFYKDNKGIIDGSEYLKNYSERMKDAQEETRRLLDSMKPLTDAQRVDRTAFRWIVNADGQIEKIRVMTDEQAKQVVLQDKYNERLARTIEMVKSYAAVLGDAVGKMADEALSHGLRGVLRVGLRSVSDSIHQMVIDSMKKSVTGAGTGMLAKLFHVKTAATPLDANTQALKDLTDVLNGKSGGSKGGIFDLPRYPWDERIPNPALGSGGGGGGFWGIIGTLLGGASGGSGGGGHSPQNYVFGSHGLGGGGHAPSAPGGGGHTINEGAVHVHVHLPSGSRVDDVQLGLIRSHVQKGVEDARKSNRLVKRYGN